MSHVAIPSEIIDIQVSELASSLARREVLSHVLESETFRKSPRLREFLEFVGTRALNGNSESVSELQIGIHVFQRGPDFSPSEDNIVRATARALRTKLREYYDSEGASDPYRIEIPKGSYVPVFLASTRLQAHPPAGAIGRRISPVQAWFMALAASLLMVLTAYLILENQRLEKQGETSAMGISLLDRILGPNATVTIVGSDALHFQSQLREERKPNLAEYALTDRSSSPQSPANTAKRFDAIQALPLIHGDEVRAAVQLARSLASDANVRFVHARNVSMNAFQRGGDFVILGGRRANPWAALFEKGLQFEMAFPSATASGIFLNRSPREGEQSEYRAHTKDSQNGIAYGRVAILPGLYGNGKVVLIAGTTGEATFAATDFLTQPRGLEQVEKLVGGKVGTNVAHLEVLVETSTVAGSTLDYRIVAVR